jgi:hypothetical protein
VSEGRDAAENIRSHIDAAHAAAEQLVREAEARAREQAEGVPARGWEAPRQPAEERPAFPELAALVHLLESVRNSIPPELTTQLADALRELLVALRALLDWYIDRLEHFRQGSSASGAPAEPRVQDIPIE